MSHTPFSEILAENRVAISQQVAWELVKRKGFSKLLSGRFSRWMGGHLEMENAAAFMGQHRKHVEDLKTNCR